MIYREYSVLLDYARLKTTAEVKITNFLFTEIRSSQILETQAYVEFGKAFVKALPK